MFKSLSLVFNVFQIGRIPETIKSYRAVKTLNLTPEISNFSSCGYY